MSTPPNSQAGLVLWWMSRSSMSLSPSMKQIAVAGAVDRHPGADREPAFLAFPFREAALKPMVELCCAGTDARCDIDRTSALCCTLAFRSGHL
jgi:hypothetical protein